MATKELQTRIALKHDSYVNWHKWYKLVEGSATEVAAPNTKADDFSINDYLDMGAALTLLPGEIAICAIPAYDETNQNNGASEATTAPTVLFKVGDGKHRFYELKWGSALAADVYNWAKAKTVVVEDEVDFKETVDGKEETVKKRALVFKTGDNIVDKVDLSVFATQAYAAELAAAINNIEAELGISSGDVTDLLTTRMAEAEDQLKEILGDPDVENDSGRLGAVETELSEFKATILGDGDKNKGTIETRALNAEATAKAYTDAEIKKLTDGAIKDNADDIDAIEAALGAGAFNNEGGSINDRINKLEVFFADPDGNGLDAALDTLVEIQEFITSEGQAADELLATVNGIRSDIGVKAKDAVGEVGKEGYEAPVEATGIFADITAAQAAINALEATVDGVEGTAGLVDKVSAIEADLNGETGYLAKVDALDVAINGNGETGDAAVKGLEARTRDLEDVVFDTGSEDAPALGNAALREAIDAITEAIGDVDADNSLAGKLKAAEDAIDAIEADYLKAADQFIINCGSSTENVFPQQTTAN